MITNEQRAILAPLAIGALFVATVIVLLFYVYWREVKSIGLMFKGGVIAVLIAIGLMDDTNNNNSDAT